LLQIIENSAIKVSIRIFLFSLIISGSIILRNTAVESSVVKRKIPSPAKCRNIENSIWVVIRV
jgi:hypothetical protein